MDALQLRIETDTALTHNTKVTYLQGIEMMLKKILPVKYEAGKLTQAFGLKS